MLHELKIYAQEFIGSRTPFQLTASVYAPEAGVRPEVAILMCESGYSFSFGSVLRPAWIYRFRADPTLVYGTVLTPRTGNILMELEGYDNIRDVHLQYLTLDGTIVGNGNLWVYYMR